MLVVGEEGTEKHSVVLDSYSDTVVDPLNEFAFLGHLNWMQNIFNSMREDLKRDRFVFSFNKKLKPLGERDIYYKFDVLCI